MSERSREYRRTDRQAFRPGLDSRLEHRSLMSVAPALTLASLEASSTADPAELMFYTTANSTTRRARRTPLQANPRQHPLHARPVFIHQPRTLVADGGRSVRILTGRGGAFDLDLNNGPGVVHARPLPDGSFDIVVNGSNSSTELVIDPVRPRADQSKNQAHDFNPIFGITNEVLRVHDIDVTSGKIGAILGFRTANLSGTIDLKNDSAVDRIALNRLLPGATIRTTGDLNTLDVFTDAVLGGTGTGIFVGRDLNWMNVRGNLVLQNGASVQIARDLGLNAEPIKGSGVGGQGGLVQGNLQLPPGSSFIIGRDLVGNLTINGNLDGLSQLSIGGLAIGNLIVRGTITL